ncbi:lytic transglycosylase domain-containing protein [Sphingobium sp.]|uniref:lytic transglycosylase domain-containing protein n=1 Tax=Sphingobium sp. TaxID=1912891 RepID=UPI003BB5DFBD
MTIKLATCACRIAIALLAMLMLTQSSPAQARSKLPALHEMTIGKCIRQAAAGHEWLERTLWGLRDQEGGWIGAEILNTDGSYDLGPMQVNSWWVGRISKILRHSGSDVRHWLIHDACFNVRAARWIFLSALAVTGDYWQAVGAYHSPTKLRQQRYRANVAEKLIKRFGSDLFE